MATVVIQQPDDVPCIGVSEDNPYKSVEDSLFVDEPRAVYFGQTLVHIPTTSIIHAVELERSSYFLKFICMFDTLFALFNAAITGYFLFLVAAALNYMGYLGAKKFRPTYLYVYVMFLAFNTTSKILYLSMVPTDPSEATIISVSAVVNMSVGGVAVKFARGLRI